MQFGVNDLTPRRLCIFCQFLAADVTEHSHYVVVSSAGGAFKTRSVVGVRDVCPSSVDNVIVQSGPRDLIPSPV